MNVLIGLIIVFFVWIFLFKLIFGIIGFAFKLAFGVVELVFCILGAILGGGLLTILGLALFGGLLFLPVLFLAKKR